MCLEIAREQFENILYRIAYSELELVLKINNILAKHSNFTKLTLVTIGSISLMWLSQEYCPQFF